MTQPGTTGDPVAMRQAAKEFEGTVNAMMRQLQAVNSHVANVPWKGEAATKYQQVMDLWGKQFDRIVLNLDAMKDILNQTSVHYDANEYEQVHVVSQLQGVLDGLHD